MSGLRHSSHAHALGHPAPQPGSASLTGHANQIARRAALASIVTAVTLISLKTWAVAETGSVSVLGSLADSALDLIASLITFGGVRWAMQPADEDHRFGHGKAEALAGFLQVLIILGSAGIIAQSAIGRLLAPETPARPELGIFVSLAAIAVTLLLLRVQNAAIRATGSLAIQTDRMHYLTDLGVNLSVIAALALEAIARVEGADAVFGIGIALYLMFSAIRAGGRAVDVLMDREWPETERQRLMSAARSHPEVRSVHEVRTRGRGQHSFAQLHIWVDPDMTVAAAHDVVDAVELRVGEAFPGIELIVHIDPEGHLDARPGPAKRA